MTLRELRSITFFALALAAILPAQAKPVASANAEVQMLANFPALQRLAVKSDAKSLRRYLARVSTAYRQVDYDAFAEALPRAGSLIALFGDSRAGKPGTLKKARATLRRLEAGLAQNRRIVLPARTGERIPDYYGIATAFTGNAARAIRNLAAGKSVANFLRKKTGSFWITNFEPGQFTFEGNTFFTVTFSPSDFTTTSAGTQSVWATNTYSGATSTSAGYLSGIAIEMTSGGSVSWQNSVGSSISLDQTAGYHWIAFPPEVEIPSEWSTFEKLNLSTPYTGNEQIFPTGTRLVKAPLEFVAPENTLELPNGISLTPERGTLTFTWPSPTPSPTPAQ